LLTTKNVRDKNFRHVFLTEHISEAIFLSSTTATNAMNFPLYLYPEDDGQQTLDGQPERTPNLDAEIVQQIADGLGLRFVPEKENGDRRVVPEESGTPRDDSNRNSEPVIASESNEMREARQSPSHDSDTFAPIDLLDYIYAVLHSPGYREKYKEFL